MQNIAVVLVRPSLSENIGTAARAAANMGLGRLVLVAPYRMEMDIIKVVGTRGAEKLIDAITVYEDVESALADIHFAVGTTARRGSHRGPFFTPRNLAPELLSQASEHQVALVFGPERSGLTTAELRLCQAVARIPTADPKSSSINLAQAVLILAYELLMAAVPEIKRPGIKPAPLQSVNSMYEHLARTLVGIGFLPNQNTDHWLMSFKRIFNRSGLTEGDCNLLRGVCRQIEWAVANLDRLPDPEEPSEE